jgi:hypothetical protein
VADGNGARPNSDILEVTGAAPVIFAEFAAGTAPAWKQRKESPHEDAHRQP